MGGKLPLADCDKQAANQIEIGGVTLWQAMCAEYASKVSPIREGATRGFRNGRT
jgi:hypothetical protein